MSFSEDTSYAIDLNEAAMSPSKCKDGVRVNDFNNEVTELHFEDGSKLTQNLNSNSFEINASSVSSFDEEDEEVEDEEEEEVITAEILNLSGYGSCKAGDPVYGEDDDVEGQDDLTAEVLTHGGYGSVKTYQSKPIPLPSCANLVSAMKGSRERKGEPPKELSVKWAPDVYEPPPSASNIVRHKQPRLKSDSKKNNDLKKRGKNKEKGSKFSKGGQSGKDKRQGRMNKYQSPDNDDW